MHNPWRHGAGFDPYPSIVARISAQGDADLFWSRGALTAPYSPVSEGANHRASSPRSRHYRWIRRGPRLSDVHTIDGVSRYAGIGAIVDSKAFSPGASVDAVAQIEAGDIHLRRHLPDQLVRGSSLVPARSAACLEMRCSNHRGRDARRLVPSRLARPRKLSAFESERKIDSDFDEIAVSEALRIAHHRSRSAAMLALAASIRIASRGTVTSGKKRPLAESYRLAKPLNLLNPSPAVWQVMGQCRSTLSAKPTKRRGHSQRGCGTKPKCSERPENQH
jgi:hypothetical protein